ncbi:MAG: ribonuclease P protein component [Planctomycetota bacterium]
MKRFSFGKEKKLKSNEQFKAVLSKGRRFDDELLVVYTAENDCGHARLGVSVNKSLGGAVVRSRLKRLVREVFRQSQGEIPGGFDYVVMLSPQWKKRIGEEVSAAEAAGRLGFEQVRESFLNLVELAFKNRGVV